MNNSDRFRKTPVPNFMDLLTVSTESAFTVSTESALTEERNSVLTASAFHGLVTNFGFCACVVNVTRRSTRRLACRQGVMIVSAEFGD